VVAAAVAGQAGATIDGAASCWLPNRRVEAAARRSSMAGHNDNNINNNNNNIRTLT
jgi:hypothetical protein